MRAYRTRSGLDVPVLGLGTWGMGGRMARDPDNDDDRDIAAIRLALENGVTHIDTAEAYAAGHAETLVSRAVEGIPRDKICLASKVYGTNLTHDGVLAACDASLARLNTDYLDLYYVHYRNAEVPLAETARALNALRRDFPEQRAVSDAVPLG